ncbi:RNA polymerase sigma factor [Botrimarina hoheduenensis]|uniref:RNA polymerase sigma factor n=2 Tax=Botrimarina hoheduenensis TaxID=2528000 RepID=A0A5C5VWI5_9BACT|nr:RNA polymerase sigma factor [Botrimarina hoheduenensis]
MNAVSQPLRMDLRRATKPPGEGPGDRLLELVQLHQAALWRYLRYLGAQESEADDLTQDTFLAVTRSDYEHRSDAQAACFLRTVARRQLLTLRRRQQREATVIDLEAAEAVWIEREPELWDDQLEALRDCVTQLEGRSRQAIDRHYRDKASREAIAAELDLSPDGVKSLLRRTRAVLRECVERWRRSLP